MLEKLMPSLLEVHRQVQAPAPLPKDLGGVQDTIKVEIENALHRHTKR